MAVIAPRLAAIADVQLAAAMTTAQKPRQEQFSAPYCSGDRGAFAGRIVGNHTLVPVELAPGDITFVLILEQHIPFRLRAPQTALDAFAAVLDAHLAHRAAKGVGASIDGIGQDVVDGVVERQPPGDAAPLRCPVACDGQRNALVPQPHVHLTNALQFGKLGEDQAKSFLHPLVGILLDPIAPSPHIACRDTEEQRTAARFLLQRFLGALPKERQLQLAHGAFHAEQSAIIGMPRIIDAVLVYDDGPDKSTELNQRVPVAAVASQPRRFDRKYGTDAASADRGQQTLEARPIDPTTRAAKIIVDDLDRSPAELPGMISEPVLTAAALRIVQELIGRRLADVDKGAATQMVSRDLGHRRPPRPPALPRSRAVGLLRVLPVVPSVREAARRAAPPARTGPADCLRFCASFLAFSILESDWRKPRSASISERTDRRTSSENRGSVQS